MLAFVTLDVFEMVSPKIGTVGGLIVKVCDSVSFPPRASWPYQLAV